MSTDVSTRKGYPIYILLDVSRSMRRRSAGGSSPQQEFTRMIPDLIMSLSDAPPLATTAWISVIAFGDQAELLCPLTPLQDPVQVRAPRDGAQTDYAETLRFLHDRIDPDRRAVEEHAAGRGAHASVARPLVFFITDGAPYTHGVYQPPEEWMPHRDRLVGDPIGARIAAIGLAGAHQGTLRQLATGRPGGPRNAFIADPDAKGDELARSVINVIERSIKLSVRAGDMVIDVPPGMRRVDE